MKECSMINAQVSMNAQWPMVNALNIDNCQLIIEAGGRLG